LINNRRIILADYKGKWIKFTGKAYWVRIGSKTDDAYDPQWNLRLELDAPSLKAFKASGIQKELRDVVTGKPDPDGTMVQFSRKVLKIFKGVPTYFTPPKVYNKDRTVMTEYVDNDGNPVTNVQVKDGYKRVGPEPILGNGSEIEVSIYMFPTKKGIGSQLDSVRIIDLIEYNPELPVEDEQEAEPEAKAEVVEAPKEEKKPKGKAPW